MEIYSYFRESAKKNDQCKQGDRSDSNDNGYPQRGDT